MQEQLASARLGISGVNLWVPWVSPVSNSRVQWFLEQVCALHLSPWKLLAQGAKCAHCEFTMVCVLQGVELKEVNAATLERFVAVAVACCNATWQHCSGVDSSTIVIGKTKACQCHCDVLCLHSSMRHHDMLIIASHANTCCAGLPFFFFIADILHCAKSYRPFELFANENCKLQNEAKMNVVFERDSARDTSAQSSLCWDEQCFCVKNRRASCMEFCPLGNDFVTTTARVVHPQQNVFWVSLGGWNC